MALIGGFALLSSAVEATRDESRPPPKAVLGLHESRRTVFKLSLLFALDAFGGGFVIQSIIAYWFHVRFQLDPAMLGTIFLFANLLAGVSALAAGWLARRIGLMNTMIFTHLPSNVLLILVPLMPDVYWAIGLLLLRFSISQMDVPTRQAYTMAVVRPDERSAAAGVTGSRPVGGCFDLAHDGDRPCRQRWMDERAVLPRRGTEDSVRPVAVQSIFKQQEQYDRKVICNPVNDCADGGYPGSEDANEVRLDDGVGEHVAHQVGRPDHVHADDVRRGHDGDCETFLRADVRDHAFLSGAARFRHPSGIPLRKTVT